MSGLDLAFIVLGFFSKQTRIFHSAQDKHKKYHTTTGWGSFHTHLMVSVILIVEDTTVTEM